MDVSVVLFTQDLRLADNPALTGALKGSRRVVPLFVVDTGIRAAGFAVPNRAAFLADALADLDAALRARGGRLVIRTGDVVEETCRTAARAGAGAVHIAGGVSRYAVRREQRLRAALGRDGRELVVHEGSLTAVTPGAVVPAGKDHFAVFTPYLRRWERTPVRSVLHAPRTVPVPGEPGKVTSEPLPSACALAAGTPPADGATGAAGAGTAGTAVAALPAGPPAAVSPGLPAGGESEARRRLRRWEAGPLDRYADRHDDLAADATSRLSPYLHFGCLSPVESLHRSRAHSGPGAQAFVRQLAWRDFHYQVLAARPDAAHRDYRDRGRRWHEDQRAFAAWREGRTGIPVVDAAMRQLLYEGWMPGRARLLTAGFLTKTLGVHWRTGARHFLDLLVDGDVANNQLNWQWAAGTGTDTRPNRVLNPLTQARRFDPDGDYVRRWLPELRALPGGLAHRPWRLPAADRAALGYPEPIVEVTRWDI